MSKTINEWIERNSARETNMKEMYESIIRDYGGNDKNQSGLYLVKKETKDWRKRRVWSLS
jgi:hypothetical protein